MGAKARIYSESGSLLAETSYVYNIEAYHVVFSDFASIVPTSGKYYYGKGVTRAYNGNGYTDYNSLDTPNFTV